MVRNPDYHPSGDFALVDGRIDGAGATRKTFANIGLYDTALFRELAARNKAQTVALLRTVDCRAPRVRRAFRRSMGERRHAAGPRGARSRRSATARRIDEPSACRSARLRDLLSRARHRPETRMPDEHAANPLLDFSGLPRLDAIRPEHVTPGDRPPRRRRAQRDRRGRHRYGPGQLGQRRRAACRRARPVESRVGRRPAPERGREHARAARRATTRICRRSPRSSPTSRRTRGSTHATARCAESPSFAALDPAERKRASTTSCAISASAAPSCRRRRRRASRRSKRSSPSSPRDSTTTCSMRPTRGRCIVDDAAELAGVPARCARRSARRGGGRGQAAAGSSRCACRATCR